MRKNVHRVIAAIVSVAAGAVCAVVASGPRVNAASADVCANTYCGPTFSTCWEEDGWHCQLGPNPKGGGMCIGAIKCTDPIDTQQ